MQEEIKKHEMQEQEIDLADYARVIVKRWKVALTVFLVLTILSSLLLVKAGFQAYRSREISVLIDTSLSNETEDTEELVISVEEVRKVIDEMLLRWKEINGKKKDPELVSLNAKISTTIALNLIRISTIQDVRMQENGKKLANKLVEVVLKKGEKIIEKEKKKIKNEVMVVEDSIRVEKDEIVKLEKILEILPKKEKSLLVIAGEVENNAKSLMVLRENTVARENSRYDMFEKLTGADSVLTNIKFSKELNEQLNELDKKGVDEQIKINDIEENIRKLIIQKERLDLRAANLRNIMLIGKSKVFRVPDKVKKVTETFVVCIIFSFFASILAVFVVEFLKKMRTKE